MRSIGAAFRRKKTQRREKTERRNQIRKAEAHDSEGKWFRSFDPMSGGRRVSSGPNHTEGIAA